MIPRIISIGEARIDLEKQLVFGPWKEDEIPFSVYHAHQDKFGEDFDLMMYQEALIAIPFRENLEKNEDDTRYSIKIEYRVQVKPPYTYVQTERV